MLHPAAESTAAEKKAARAPVAAPKAKSKTPVIEIRRGPIKNRPENREMKVYLDSKGVPVLTNTPERYQHRKDFVEVKIDFDPLVVPKRIKTLSAQQRLSAAGIQDIVREYAKIYALDENLIYAIIRVESNFNPNAVSPAGARGLMQLMPGTASDMGVADIFDPAENIGGGAQYIAKLLTLFENDLTLALAGYNAGPEAVKRHGGIPPYQETQNYVKLVKQYHEAFKSTGPKPGDIVMAAAVKPKTAFLPSENNRYYMVHFNSGLTQPAEEVIEEDAYYIIKIRNRLARINKDHVQKIVQPA